MVSRGWQINVGLYKENAEYVRTALVAANAIFHDLGDRRKPEYLEKIVTDSLQGGWKENQEKTSVLGKLKVNQERQANNSRNCHKEKQQITYNSREK